MLQRSLFAFETSGLNLCAVRRFVSSLSNARKIEKLVEHLDKKGLVVTLKKSEIKENYLAGGTKGGQKANKSHSLVQLQHVPTGKTAEGKETRFLPDNYKYAMAKLRMAVDIHLKGEESQFVILKKEEEEKARLARESKKAEQEEKRKKEENLKAILSEEDTLKY